MLIEERRATPGDLFFLVVTSASFWGFPQSYCMNSVKTFPFRHMQMFCVEKEDATFCQRAIWLSFGRGGCCTVGCLSILRALFCSFSSEPFSKQWSEEFHYHFLNKLSCVPPSDLLHVCTVQPPNTCYQDTVPANNCTLWVLQSSTTPPLLRQRAMYFNTTEYLSYGICKKTTNTQWICVLFICQSSHHFTNVSGYDDWCTADSINEGRQQMAMFI